MILKWFGLVPAALFCLERLGRNEFDGDTGPEAPQDIHSVDGRRETLQPPASQDAGLLPLPTLTWQPLASPQSPVLYSLPSKLT